jgi:NAD kinase
MMIHAKKIDTNKFKENLDYYLNNIFMVYKHIGCSGGTRASTTLDSLGYKHQKLIREKVSKNTFNQKKFVIIVAGDGTTLRVCQHIHNDCLVFTVNNHPLITEGFLTRATVDNLNSKFNNIVKGKFKIRPLQRLQVKINGKLLSKLALNEVSISARKSYHTFIYNLNKNIEKASGILVSTPIGSTGWLRSTGGKKLSINSNKMVYAIREPYNGRIYKVKKKSDIVDNFTFKALVPGIIVFDSVEKEFKFNKDDIIEVSYSDNPIYFVEP